LVDTAAQTTVVWKNIVGSRNINRSKYELLGLYSQPIDTHGSTVMDEGIKGKTFQISAHVIEPCRKLYDGLLGLDFLLEHRAKIDVAELVLERDGEFLPLNPLSVEFAKRMLLCKGVINPTSAYKDMQVTVRLPQGLSIPQGASRLVQVKIPVKLKLSKYYVIHPNTRRP
jgi:hypothetical protein